MADTLPAGAGVDPTVPLPMFYRQLAPLDPARHAGLRMPARADVSFAATTNSLPIMREEFPAAQRCYPIVFANGDRPLPIVLVGLRDRENLFLEEIDAIQGYKWRDNAYVPAYIRRYPFALVAIEGQDSMAVCIDDEAVLGPRDGEYIFGPDGQLAPYGQEIMNLCQSFEAQIKSTEEFAADLNRLGLLDMQTAEVLLPSGERFTLSGFSTVNQDRFNQLPAETLAEWRDKGWLTLVYAHFLSLGTWQSLVDMTAARGELKAESDERFSRDAFLNKVLYNT